MGDKWREMKLGDFAPFLYGKGLSETSRNQSGNIPVFGSNGIIGKHDVAFVKKAGVIIGRKGTVGAVHFSKIPFWPIDTTFYVEESGVSDIRFVYYLLRSLGLEHMNADSAVPGLNRNAAHAVKIKIPPLPEQKAIASILGALDDKIELNRKMNETLEAMARAIFKSCFSYPFDGLKYLQAETPSPDLTGHPLPLGEGRGEGELELVDSLLGKIPKGWRVGTLSELCEKPQYGFTASAKETPIGKKFLRITDINKQAWIDWSSVPYCEITPEQFEQYRVKTGDILIARMADPGHGVLIEEDVDAVFASYLIRFRPIKLEYSRYLQYWLRSPEYWDLVHAQSAGTTRASLNAQILRAFQLVIPTEDVAITFQNAIDIIRSKVNSNVKESLTLASIRDALLPKLLSGEIRVKDAERFVEEAV